jgi:hypothetical protein
LLITVGLQRGIWNTSIGERFHPRVPSSLDCTRRGQSRRKVAPIALTPLSSSLSSRCRRTGIFIQPSVFDALEPHNPARVLSFCVLTRLGSCVWYRHPMDCTAVGPRKNCERLPIPTIEDFARYTGGHTHRKWQEVGLDWRCPSCKRTKFEQLTWTQLLGIPRIVSTAADLGFLLDQWPGDSNGITFCTGALGVRADNDLPADGAPLCASHLVRHLRSTQCEADGESLFEASHLEGDADLIDTVIALVTEEKRRRMGGRRTRPPHPSRPWATTSDRLGQECSSWLSRDRPPARPRRIARSDADLREPAASVSCGLRNLSEGGPSSLLRPCTDGGVQL